MKRTLLLVSCSFGLVACDPPPSASDPDAAVVDRDAPGGADDAFVSGDPDAFVPGSGCPAYDVDDPSQVSYGRNSPGPAVIDADTTWDAAHTYFVIGSLDVQGVTLTIEAGTRVCLDAGSGSAPMIDFRERSSGGGTSRLVVNGTPEAPVVFEPATPDSSWNAITLSSASSASLSHLTLIGGGVGGAGVLQVSDNFVGPLDAEEVHLVGTRGTMLSLRNPEGLAAGASIHLDAQDPDVIDVAVASSLSGLATLSPSSLVVGDSLTAEARVVRVSSGLVERDTTIPGDLGMTFLFRDDVIVQRADASSPLPTLTIEAGADLAFDGTSIQVGSAAGLEHEGGNLVAVGTTSAPIRLRSASAAPAAGDWQGLIVVATATELDVTELSHVVIEDAGRDLGGGVLHCDTTPTPMLGAIRLRGNGFEDYEGPRMSSVEIVRSAGEGVAFACSSASCLLTDYTGAVTGTEIAGELLRTRDCP
jgi:hypothetical protein